MGIKLLLADDSITIQKVIGIIFGSDDYSLTVVDNGRDAVQKATELTPDVLLIDAVMPGMSGYEVCEAIRAIPSLATKPILMLSGSFEPFDEDKAKKCGADDHLAKPFESQQILNKVKELAELGSSRDLSGASTQPDLDASPETFSIPASSAYSEAEPTSESASDIWGAFTTEAEPLSSPQHASSEWIPAVESPFEFQGENESDTDQTPVSEQPVSLNDSGFGEISFEEELPSEETPEPTTEIPPALSDLILQEPEITHPAESAPLLLSEEQLKAAITAASKEVIERIVWEVVPDLAEAMISEAIRKIKEGA